MTDHPAPAFGFRATADREGGGAKPRRDRRPYSPRTIASESVSGSEKFFPSEALEITITTIRRSALPDCWRVLGLGFLEVVIVSRETIPRTTMEEVMGMTFSFGPCPHCGYCPHCGRSYQLGPFVPWSSIRTLQDFSVTYERLSTLPVPDETMGGPYGRRTGGDVGLSG